MLKALIASAASLALVATPVIAKAAQPAPAPSSEVASGLQLGEGVNPLTYLLLLELLAAFILVLEDQLDNDADPIPEPTSP